MTNPANHVYHYYFSFCLSKSAAFFPLAWLLIAQAVSSLHSRIDISYILTETGFASKTNCQCMVNFQIVVVISLEDMELLLLHQNNLQNFLLHIDVYFVTLLEMEIPRYSYDIMQNFLTFYMQNSALTETYFLNFYVCHYADFLVII
jgi:hypothetical protein